MSAERDGLRAGFDWEAAKAHLAAADPRLSAAAALVGWPEAPPSWGEPPSLFAGLVRAVIAQQLSARAAAAIERRLAALCEADLAPEALIAAGATQLRGVGLSAAKVRTLLTLAEGALKGRLPQAHELRNWPDEAIVASLCRFPGVGRWTAEMVLIFTLGRPDVLAVTDLGLRRGFAYLQGQEKPVSATALAAAGAGWRPWRTLASLMLWRLAAYGPLDQHQCQGS